MSTFTTFLNHALTDTGACWRSEIVEALSGLYTPEIVFGRRSSMLRGDANRTWANWFATGIIDPFRYIGEKESSYAYIFRDTLAAVATLYPQLTKPERMELSGAIARHIDASAALLKKTSKRRQYSYEDKRELLDLAGSSPRCWICGYAFQDYAIDRYLGREVAAEPSPVDFFDVFKPIGLKARDVSLEIDHLLPFALGGGDEDNLRIACGWCNRHKSSLVSLYDSEGRQREAGLNTFGFSSLPQPFWTIRTLALQRKCEHLDGCSKTSSTAELTITSMSSSGALTPTNLRVTCYEHDPIRAVRLQPRSIVERIWSKG